MILMNDSCEVEGKHIPRNNYSRRWYLQSVLQWTCLWGSAIVTWIANYILRHCSVGVSKHLMPSKPNVLIPLPCLLHPSFLLVSLQPVWTLGATSFWEQTTSLWLGKVPVSCCRIKDNSIPRKTYRRLLHKLEQAAILNDLTGCTLLPFPIYYPTQHLN